MILLTKIRVIFTIHVGERVIFTIHGAERVINLKCG